MATSRPRSGRPSASDGIKAVLKPIVPTTPSSVMALISAPAWPTAEAGNSWAATHQ